MNHTRRITHTHTRVRATRYSTPRNHGNHGAAAPSYPRTRLALPLRGLPVPNALPSPPLLPASPGTRVRRAGQSAAYARAYADIAPDNQISH